MVSSSIPASTSFFTAWRAVGFVVLRILAVGTENSRIVKLNGLPPRTSVFGSLFASVGETASLTVHVEFASHEPFNYLELLVLSDLDDDGDKETVASTALRSLSPVPGAGIPIVSQWGLVILALLLLTGAKLKFGRPPTQTRARGVMPRPRPGGSPIHPGTP